MILINGCSHSAELTPGNTYWSTLLKQHTAHEIVNVSFPGASNHRIFRTTINHLSTASVKPSLVIIGWTCHERFEYSFDSKIEYYNFQRHNLFTQPSPHKDFLKFADLHLADWEFGLTNTLTYMCALQQFLKSHNIPYLYINMFNSIPTVLTAEDQCLFDMLDKNCYLNPHQSVIQEMIETFQHTNPEYFDNTMHLVDEHKHQEIADAITNTDAWKHNIGH